MNLVNSPGQDETDTSIPYMIDADGEIRWILDWEKSDCLLYTSQMLHVVLQLLCKEELPVLLCRLPTVSRGKA